ncbi:BnaC07g50530D [Brassica napus]|uniref:BnaC07g50530D protein n=1 Tax=Brassica napus TaxID=3708 RepID=A0A078JHT2_BRANA|nr:BnaC07g50530D [Brassica napus]
MHETIASFQWASGGVDFLLNLAEHEDLAALRPTVFSSVPRLYNRIYDGITNAVKSSGGMKERLFNAAYNSKKQALLNGKNASAIWDRLVFNKIKDKLGGRVRFMTSGASPMSPEVMEFMKICFGARVLEGYGMTETACVISGMDEGDNLIGHVGSPNPACGWKLLLLRLPLRVGPTNSVIHGFTPVGCANHYMPSLKAGFIVKVDHVVGQIHSVQGSGLTKETTRVVIRLLIDP